MRRMFRAVYTEEIGEKSGLGSMVEKGFFPRRVARLSELLVSRKRRRGASAADAFSLSLETDETGGQSARAARVYLFQVGT